MYTIHHQVHAHNSYTDVYEWSYSMCEMILTPPPKLK